MATKKRTSGKRKPAQSTPNTGPSFVGKEEFDKFKEENSQTQLAILQALENIAKAPAPQAIAVPGRAFSVAGQPEPTRQATVAEASAERSNYTLNPAHQAIFEEYFDPEDGFEARLEYPYFSIIVPEKFCNATPAWKQFYKKDVRLKFLRYDNIEGGMRDWCKLVASNLKYNKSIKTK